MPMQTSMPGGAAAAKPLHATESDAATNSPACLPDTGFLRQRQVLAFVPISKSTLWRQVRALSFPSPVKLSAGVTYLQASRLQHLTHFGKQGLAQFVLLQQAAKLQQRGPVRHTLTPQIDVHKAAQPRAVEQGFLTGFVGQVEPVLHEVHPQHAFEPDRWAPVAGLGVVRLNDRAQRLPRHDLFHRRQERIALGRLAVGLESVALIGCHRQGLLLHLHLRVSGASMHANLAPLLDLFSEALNADRPRRVQPSISIPTFPWSGSLILAQETA